MGKRSHAAGLASAVGGGPYRMQVQGEQGVAAAVEMTAAAVAVMAAAVAVAAAAAAAVEDAAEL